MKLRRTVFLAMIAVAAFGLAAKLYPGPARRWVNNFGPASVAYVVFFMLAAFLISPRRELATRIAVGVLLVTCVLEFLQLWHPPWLQAIRSTSLGQPAGHEFLVEGLPRVRGGPPPARMS